MDATTTRASTVIRSMPTSETRTQASMTIPLSSTRSRTSMRLVPPEALSTGIVRLPCWLGSVAACSGLAAGRRRPARQRFHLALEQADLVAKLLLLHLHLLPSGGEVLIVPPPVEPDLLRLVDRAHDQPHADGEQLDLGQRDLDVASDDQALVEHPIESVHQTAAVTS